MLRIPKGIHSELIWQYCFYFEVTNTNPTISLFTQKDVCLFVWSLAEKKQVTELWFNLESHNTPRRKLVVRMHLILQTIFQINNRAVTFKISTVTLLMWSWQSQETHPAFHSSNKTSSLIFPHTKNWHISFTLFLLLCLKKPCSPLTICQITRALLHKNILEHPKNALLCCRASPGSMLVCQDVDNFLY